MDTEAVREAGFMPGVVVRFYGDHSPRRSRLKVGVDLHWAVGKPEYRNLAATTQAARWRQEDRLANKLAAQLGAGQGWQPPTGKPLVGASCRLKPDVAEARGDTSGAVGRVCDREYSHNCVKVCWGPMEGGLGGRGRSSVEKVDDLDWWEAPCNLVHHKAVSQQAAAETKIANKLVAQKGLLR